MVIQTGRTTEAVTPEMMKAGGNVVLDFLTDFETPVPPLGPYSAQVLARKVFEEMTRQQHKQ